MWVVGDTLMLWPMIPVALRWMHMDERKAVRIDRELDAQALAEAARLGRARSAAEVHQLDAHPVGVGAVDELERRAAEVDGGPARLDHGAPELDDPRRRRCDVAHPEGQVGQPELVDRPPLALAERARAR